MEKEITCEDLKDGVYIYTSKSHKFGSDSILLSNFSGCRNSERIADLGTGCGIISLLLAKTANLKEILAVDIQVEAIDLLKKSIVKSNFSSLITPLLCDINKLPKSYYDKFDKVVSNPPYKAIGTGIESSKDSRRIARHETNLSLEEVVFISSKLLKSEGKLYLSGKAERLVEIITAMKSNKIEPKRIKFCAKDNTSQPWLVLIEGKKSGKPFLKVEPTLFVYDNNCKKTKEIKTIYNSFNKKGNKN